MKILYVAPEHVSGTLTLFKQEHERRGDSCRFITFWHSRWDFPDDICLELSGMPDRGWVRGLRNLVSQDPHRIPSRVIDNQLPCWNPNWLVRSMFSLRDEHNWKKIAKAISDYALFEFDILHLDSGADLTRDARFARSFAKRGKHVVSYFHGSDLRSRGYIPAVDEITELRLTPEWDLLDMDSRLHYLYLPFNRESIPHKSFQPGQTVRIGHAARNPLKGTASVIAAIETLKQKHSVELIMIKDMSYTEALKVKFTCDIFIDQLTNEGGWGYGMSGVEALAMGIPVITNIPVQMQKYIGVHPFIQADSKSLCEVIEKLLSAPKELAPLSMTGRDWAVERHDIRNVADVLYGHYKRMSWLPL